MKNMLYIVVLIVGICPKLGKSSQDPFGDIYPIVKVEDGYFVVYYYNNTKAPYKYTAYKTVIDKDGRVISSRQEARYPKCATANVELSENEKGIIVEYGEIQYIFANSYKIYKGRPILTKVVKERKERMDIKWKDGNILIIHSVVIYDDKAIITYTKEIEDEEKNGKCEHVLLNMVSKPVTVGIIDIKEMKEIINVIIGVPERSRVAPRMSKIILYKDAAHMSWIERHKNRIMLNLSSWEINTNRISHKILKVLESSNVSISIANIDDKLLIAYHENGEIKYVIEAI